MRKLFYPILAALLSTAMMAGPALTAFGATDDSNYGPAFASSSSSSSSVGQVVVSQEAPSGDASEILTVVSETPGSQSTASTETATQTTSSGPGVVVSTQETTEESPSASETDQTEESTEETSILTEVTSETGDETDTDLESTQLLQEATSTSQAHFQFQLLKPDLTWTDPITDDTTMTVGEGGFLGMSIYIVNLPGDVLYRTYTTAAGWSDWAMNGGHTAWNLNCPVEAVQIRLNGVFGNAFDIYYSSTLSDGTQCGWSMNGTSNGTMGTGLYISGLRLSIWAKGTGDTPYDMSNPLVAVSSDGIQFVDGIPYYTSGTGTPFTGWGWNDRDRYYFVNNNPVIGWQYIDGYKYFFEADGKLVTDLEPYMDYQGPFLIKVNKEMNCTTIYIEDGDNGYIIPYKVFLCSTGDDTPVGDHITPEKYRWRLMVTGEYCQYLTRLGAGLPILLHSVIYEKQDPYTLFAHTYNYLGANKSHGCIRLTTADAKWIYDHCEIGTKVTVYESSIPGPFDRPAIQVMIPDTQTYDPTDPNLPENQTTSETE